MEIWKKSKYMHSAITEDGQSWILYQFQTRQFIKLNLLQKDIFDTLSSLENIDGLTAQPFIAKLIQKGFLVNYDEYERLYQEVKTDLQERRLLSLVLIPTTACNFDCDYCLASGKITGIRMNKDTQDAVLHFVKRHIESGNFDRVKLVWFGGEPTLAPDIVAYLGTQIYEMVKNAGLAFSSSFFTNGYCLDQKMMDILEQCGVQVVHISIDGDRFHHDQYRHTKNNQGTYEHILNQIRHTKTKIEYLIRCNLNRDNTEAYLPLIEALREIAAETGNRICCVPARMRYVNNLPEEMAFLKAKELTHSEFLKWYQKYEGLRVCEMPPYYMKYFKKVSGPCSACNPNSFCIDEAGFLYKCDVQMGMPEHVIGDVFSYWQSGLIPEQADVHFFQNSILPDRARCKNCPILPVCLGRCPLTWKEKDMFECNRIITDLDRAVLSAYEIFENSSKDSSAQ